MCGISGFNFKDQSLIGKMNTKISHRGPDAEGFYIDDNISLGHRRLSIIDLSDSGRQPIFNEDKNLVIIFNGEIYNYQELINNLSIKHKFYTKTDTEVIIHLYEDLGYKCLEKLNGIFTFAIWDKRNKKLFVARDRLGVKPLYYYHQGGKFIFSSEIKAILEYQHINRQVNLEAFTHYFKLGFVPQPLTMFEGIYKLPSAHFLTIENNQLSVEKYWEINDFNYIKSKSEIIDNLRTIVDNSIQNQLIADRPVGIFLSGGIDSNVILSVARKYSTGKIKTYSVGFEDKHGDKFNSDFKLAQISSQYHQTDHHPLLISEKDVINNLEDVIYHLDEPINNPISLSIYLLAQLAKKEVAVDLSGSGGDELFGGYPRYYINKIIDNWQSLPNNLQSKLLLKIISKITKLDFYDKFSARGLDRYKQFMFRDEDCIKKVLKPLIWQPELTDKFYQQKFFDMASLSQQSLIKKSFTQYFSLIDMQTWLVDFALALGDKTTMAFGLEERVPLLDHRLVELSAKIPMKFKIRGRNTKNIFKEAMKDYIPPHIFNAPKKGFTSPTSEWLRTGLYDFAKDILSENYCLATKDFFDFKAIDKIFEDHVHRRKYNLNLIWGLITWQIWYKKFIDLN